MARCPHDQSSKAKTETETGGLLPEGSGVLGSGASHQPRIIMLNEQWASTASIGRRRRTTTVALGVVLLLVLAIPRLAKGQAAPAGATPSAAPPTSSPAPQTSASAQSTTVSPPAPQPPPSPTGWLGFEQLQYGASALGTVIIEDTDLGYGLTDHFSADIGLPVIFTRTPFSPVINHDFYWTGLLGEPYVDFKYTSSYHDLNYTSVLTGTFPVSNSDRIYTTGRFGVDWFNHVDEQIGNVTPFINFGASNGAVNRFVMPRPYSTARPFQTLGFLADGEGGLEYKFNKGHARGVGVGASAYLLVPGGPQKIFSRFVVPYSSLAGDGHHNRYFDSSFESKSTYALVDYTLLTTTISNASVTRDNGLSGWLDITRWRNLSIQLAYTRSVHYDLDIYTATFTFDARELIRSVIPHHL